MTRSIVTFKQFFLESTETEVEQYRNLFDELQQSSFELFFKGLLNSKNVKYAEQYQIDPKRKFLVDFAIPDKKIALEINGPFHYYKDISNWNNPNDKIIDSADDQSSDISGLLEYYQNRHNFIKNALHWRIIEIPTDIVVNKNKLKLIEKINEINEIASNSNIVFDYETYKKSHTPQKRLRPKNIEDGINLLKKLKETKNYKEMSIDFKNKLGLSIKPETIAELISKFCRANGISENILEVNRERIKIAIEIISSIEDRNTKTREEMFEILNKEHNLNIKTDTFGRWMTKNYFPDWIPFNKLEATKKIISSIEDRNTKTREEMLKILNKEHNLNILEGVLNRWIRNNQIPNWIPKGKKIPTDQTRKNKELVKKIIAYMNNPNNPKREDPNNLTRKEMLQKLKNEHNLNIGGETVLNKWIRNNEFLTWKPRPDIKSTR